MPSLPKLNRRTPREENALVASFRPMIHTLASDDKLVLDLSSSYQISPPNSPPVTIKTTDYDKFRPLPSSHFERFKKAVPPRPKIYCPEDIFLSPIYNDFSWWARHVTTACRSLTRAKDTLETEMECSGYSEEDTLLSSSELIGCFLDGETERSACGVRWYVTAILTSLASLDHGAILTTHRYEGFGFNRDHIERSDLLKSRGLDPSHILRSELLTLLALLRVACRRAVRDGASSTSPTVFVLSFTVNMVRVLQARLTDANQISVFIRKEFNTQIQSMEERDELFKELISSAMFVDRNNPRLDNDDDDDEQLFRNGK